ncbi:ABC transporter substrate-binding protein [Dictyobacter halimunensis]
MQTIVLLENRYRLIDSVGKGGFATVYKAEDLRSKTIVAVKEITLKDLKPQEIIDATDTYHREIRFGESLKHPALPRVYAHFMDQDHWYIVAQFIDGQTLEEYRQQLPGGQLPLDEVLSIALQVCDVLTYLHSRQPPIIFRDIKPDNIMRTRAGRIYLIDLGIARQFRPGQRRDTQALGSPGYAAPEQYGSDQTTERSDIYSLGATLQALLTGRDPLDEDTTITRKPVVLPEELSELLAEMLARDPAQRPSSIISVQRRLEQINTGIASSQASPIPVPPPAPASTPYYIPSTTAGSGNPPTAPKQRFGRLQVIAIAIALLAVLGFGSDSLLNYISGRTHHVSRSQATSIPPASQQVLNIAASNLDEPLDPATVQYTQSTQIVSMTSAGLVSLENDMRIHGQLALSWETDPQGYTWTFHLQHGLKFSDGSPLTSKDIAYSLDRALDPALKDGTAMYNLQYIQGADQRFAGKVKTVIGQGILTPDDDTLVIKLSKNIAYFLDTLTCPCASVVKKALIDKYGQNFTDHLSEGSSSGPFKIERNTKQQVDLIPNPDYYGPHPKLSRISFTAYTDAETSYHAYQTGQVSFVNNIPLSLADTASRDQTFYRSPQLTMTYVAMNYQIKPFDNIKIRQAFALAIDKDLISQTIRKGTTFPTNHIIPRGDPSANPATVGLDGNQSTAGNPEQAKQLLQEGMDEEGIAAIKSFPTVTLTYSQNSSIASREELAFLQAQWKTTLGISVKLQEMPVGTFYNLVDNAKDARNIQMWRISWAADYPDASDWTTLQFGQNSAQNTYAYGQNQSKAAPDQQVIQKTLAQADVTQDQQQRVALYQGAEQNLINDVAWLPLYQFYDCYVVKPNIYGLTVNAMGMISPDDWANIYVTQ